MSSGREGAGGFESHVPLCKFAGVRQLSTHTPNRSSEPVDSSNKHPNARGGEVRTAIHTGSGWRAEHSKSECSPLGFHRAGRSAFEKFSRRAAPGSKREVLSAVMDEGSTAGAVSRASFRFCWPARIEPVLKFCNAEIVNDRSSQKPQALLGAFVPGSSF